MASRLCPDAPPRRQVTHPGERRTTRWTRFPLLAFGLAAVAGCSGVTVHSASPESTVQAAAADPRRDWLRAGMQGRELVSEADRCRTNAAGLAGLRAAGDAPPVGRFELLGPRPIQGLPPRFRNVSGRIAAVAADPLRPTSHYLAGAASGGVWESFDGGAHWQPRTDALGEVLPIAAIGFAPSQPARVYAATGDYALDLFPGPGLLRSDDGGGSWTLRLADELGGRTASAIAVDPADADRLWVATHDGLFVSDDGGATAQQLMGGRLDDLEERPGGGGWYVAGSWSGAGERLRRSADGVVWSPVHGPWEALSIARLELAVATPAPATVYLLAAGPDGRLAGLWRSDDAWSPAPGWSAEALPPSLPTTDRQGTYDLDLLVDPEDPAVLFLGQVKLWWRRDGVEWWLDGSLHDDIHAFAVAGGDVLIGHDGGVQRHDRLDLGSESLGADLAVTQFYFGDASAEETLDAIGGTQDNGAVVRSSTARLDWSLRAPGDGGRPAISRQAPALRRVATNQGNGLWRTTDGVTWSSFPTGVDPTGKPFVSQIVLCPADDDVALFPTDNLWRSTDLFAATPPGFAPVGPEMGAEVRTASFCAADPSCQTFALGTVDGRVRVTFDGGASWLVADPPLPGPRAIGDLEFADGCGSLWIAVSGFATPGLLLARNVVTGIPAFEDLSPPLDTPCRAVAETAGGVWLGTDLGLLHAPDRGGPWRRIGPAEGLPVAPVFDLVPFAPRGELVLFTYGRGAWRLTEAAVFADGFESGDTGAWSDQVAAR